MKSTPGPWRLGSPEFRCVLLGHGKGHPGPPHCRYTFQGWRDGEYWERFVSSESAQVEIVGSDDDGPVLSEEDARLIAAAPEMLAFIRDFSPARECVGTETVYGAADSCNCAWHRRMALLAKIDGGP